MSVAVGHLDPRQWTDVVEPLDDERVRAAAHASLAWSEQRDDDFARVNAIRTRHYLEHGEWISK